MWGLRGWPRALEKSGSFARISELRDSTRKPRLLSRQLAGAWLLHHSHDSPRTPPPAHPPPQLTQADLQCPPPLTVGKSLSSHSLLPHRPRLSLRILTPNPTHLSGPTRKRTICLPGAPPLQRLTLDSVKDATVQRFAAGVVGGRADAGATAVGQRVPGVEGTGEGSQAARGRGYGAAPLPSSRALRGPHRSKKEARRRRSRTLCRVPALTWQFMSCALVMYTLVPGVGSRRVAGGPQTATFPTWPGPGLGPAKTLPDNSPRRGLVSGQARTDGGAAVHGAPRTCRALLAHGGLLPTQPPGHQKEQAVAAHAKAPCLQEPRFLATVSGNPQTTLRSRSSTRVANSADPQLYQPPGQKPGGRPLGRINTKGCQLPQDTASGGSGAGVRSQVWLLNTGPGALAQRADVGEEGGVLGRK